ncbi:hypothetical protein [Paraglaciecola sp.]|uniref:hypothetical protein n=1 Tax=Paraglaciecola sp. TaxID=1920173 RepID=UPI0030F38650
MHSKNFLNVLFGLLVSGQVFAESIVIDEKVIFAEGSDVPAAVINECELETKFTHFLNEYISDRGFTVIKANAEQASGIAKHLHIEIDRVSGGGGGAWTGGKMVHAIGTLTENGKEIASFKVQRSSSGGAFGAFKGTCSLLGRDVKAMAKDVSVWLKSPSKDGRLGEL